MIIFVLYLKIDELTIQSIYKGTDALHCHSYIQYYINNLYYCNFRKFLRHYIIVLLKI
jgi:hypothetical protein